jgi:TM2 domain-containing membrane protein YozV
MNCAKHTDVGATGYCRTCGRPMCAACTREVQGTIYCEDCLARAANSMGAGVGTMPPPPPPPPMGEHASPGLAAILGFIPGVGAMYNGQFAKGFVHVIIFATLIWLSDHAGGLFGLGVAAWLFYMVFDAYTTAKARKYGFPLPDPLGINRMVSQHEPGMMRDMSVAGERVGAGVEQVAGEMRAKWEQWQAQNRAAGTAPPPNAAYAAPATTAGATAEPGVPPPEGAAAPGATNGAPGAAPGAPFTAGPQPPYYTAPPAGYYPERHRDRGPIGAVILIVLGCLFLLDNLNLFSFRWAQHLWPVLLIAIGVWLFVRRRTPEGQ